MSATRMSSRRQCAHLSTSTARPWSVSNALPTKFRPLHRFSVHQYQKGLLINNFQLHRRTAPMSLRALDDIRSHLSHHADPTEPIDGVVRIETASLEQTAPTFMADRKSTRLNSSH